MSAAEDLVNKTEAGGKESQDNHITGLVKNNDGVNPANHQAAGGAERPVSDQTDVDRNPTSEQVGIAGNMVNNQAGAAETPAKEHVTGGAENSVHNEAGASISGMKDEAGVIDSPVNSIVTAAEISVSSQADAAANRKENPVETPVACKADRLPEEAQEMLKSLASHWEDVLDANALQVFPLKGAMTNEVFQIKWPTSTGETSRKVIVRIYGEGVDVFFDRSQEIQTFEFMSKNGQGPPLLGRFANGRVEEFIHARTLSAADLRDPTISALIAAKLKDFHDLDMPGEKEVHLWNKLRNWLSEAKRISSPKEAEAFYLDTIDKEITLLEKELSGSHQMIGFCHNDLQYGNIMLDEETNSVTIIDYEYACYNPVAFDIANHFCEMAANYHTEEPHILDYSKYPDLKERKRFVLAYLSASDGSEVEQLLQEIEKYTLANHLFWGVWGIISAQVNTIHFDYKEYAKQRFQEYWARKPYLLINSEAPSPYNVPEGTGI
ncbi:choline/ethanolamine kinase [Vigna unguiculata]|uniref:Choline/ethanolamine kinase n=1 Tax=Vigna unguiculata TaxID=3917 RepID=A0A4D6M443_VIGUN|nr:choline/ethanolamine kinase [Vigna unguiculata]